MNRATLLVEYRCRAKGCLLLAVWQTPNGPEWSTPRPSSFDEWGRITGRYTEGLEATGRLADLPWSVLLKCQHTYDEVFGDVVRAEAASRTPGKPGPPIICYGGPE